MEKFKSNGQPQNMDYRSQAFKTQAQIDADNYDFARTIHALENRIGVLELQVLATTPRSIDNLLEISKTEFKTKVMAVVMIASFCIGVAYRLSVVFGW